MRAIYPELPLWVVSDFPPDDASLPWIRYRINRSFAENLARLPRSPRAAAQIRLAGVMLVPNVPFRRMRLLALRALAARLSRLQREPAITSCCAPARCPPCRATRLAR